MLTSSAWKLQVDRLPMRYWLTWLNIQKRKILWKESQNGGYWNSGFGTRLRRSMECYANWWGTIYSSGDSVLRDAPTMD